MLFTLRRHCSHIGRWGQSRHLQHVWKGHQRTWEKLFRYPRRVAQSKVNSDLYISDNEAKTFRSPGKVVALDKNYEVRFEYTGPEGRDIFSPFDLCSDETGNVLITDYNYNTIHILDKHGRVIRYLEGLREPYSIDADSNGNAWIGDVEGVKLVKYLQWSEYVTKGEFATIPQLIKVEVRSILKLLQGYDCALSIGITYLSSHANGIWVYSILSIKSTVWSMGMRLFSKTMQ